MALAVETSAPTQGTQEQFRAELQGAVVRELEVRGIDTPSRLAEAAGIAEISAAGILRRREWTIVTSLWLIDRLELAVRLKAVSLT